MYVTVVGRQFGRPARIGERRLMSPGSLSLAGFYGLYPGQIDPVAGLPGIASGRFFIKSRSPIQVPVLQSPGPLFSQAGRLMKRSGGEGYCQGRQQPQQGGQAEKIRGGLLPPFFIPVRQDRRIGGNPSPHSSQQGKKPYPSRSQGEIGVESGVQSHYYQSRGRSPQGEPGGGVFRAAPPVVEQKLEEEEGSGQQGTQPQNARFHQGLKIIVVDLPAPVQTIRVTVIERFPAASAGSGQRVVPSYF